MNTLPACCNPPRHHWPLPLPLPGAHLVSCTFDPAQLAADDFARAAVPLTPALQRSVAKRQAEYLAGRLCAREALTQLGIAACIPGTGKDRAPLWPAGVCGSITHSHGHAAAIVAPVHACRGLGLDQETLLSDARAERLSEEILTPDECRRLDPTQLGLIVTLTFSLKESLFKALYPLTGQRFYFEHAELLGWSPDGQAHLRLLTDLSTDWQRGREIEGQFCVDNGQLLSLIAV